MVGALGRDFASRQGTPEERARAREEGAASRKNGISIEPLLPGFHIRARRVFRARFDEQVDRVNPCVRLNVRRA